MFLTTLPYSKQRFNIKKITFAEMFDVSRLLYEEDTESTLLYLETFFGICNLNVVDKFYVLLKARELYSDDTISINANEASVKLRVSRMLDQLYDIRNFERTIKHENIQITLDIPMVFITSKKQVYDHIIKKIQIDDIVINFDTITSIERDYILASLPISLFKLMQDFLDTIDIEVELYEGKESLKIGSITVNFLEQDPVILLLSIYSEYTLSSCREIMYYLSKKISDTLLLQSTMSDIKFYMEEYNKEKKQPGNSSITDLQA